MDFLLQGTPVETATLIFLILALITALGFEFINGFHDTANAVATVIYTNSLKPTHAVVLSGVFNFLGVMLSGVGVAYAIVHLLPVDLVVNAGGAKGMAMTFAILVAAVIWNLGTWYFGIPSSSSHTLIGAIIGVGVVHSIEGVHWDKAGQVGLSLVLSPLIGLALAAVLLKLLKRFADSPELHQEPKKDEPPPAWIRGILILTCSGVSFAHGSNDGQKGMGLIMLILIGLVPAAYSINMAYPQASLIQAAAESQRSEEIFQTLAGDTNRPANPTQVLRDYNEQGEFSPEVLTAAAAESARIREILLSADSVKALPADLQWELRQDTLVLRGTLGKLKADKPVTLSAEDQQTLDQLESHLAGLTEYVSDWVKVAVALALGFGTMIGWKRIVVTVGEKIGKTHLTYAQGAAAEIVAMSTIGFADIAGLPVSTTHVLSSGVAGTMMASGSGVQSKTVKNILWAWVLTLPVSMALAAGLFKLFLAVFV
jgi:PiT family inorganic phosphate transporter